MFTQFEQTSVACPFHKYLPPGESTFTVSIPKQFLTYYSPVHNEAQKRNFFFGSLRLVPDFFSGDAQLYDLDTEEDLSTVITHQFNLVHKISPLYFNAANPDNVWDLELKTGTLADSKLETFFDVVNKYTEVAKPEVLLKAPFFLTGQRKVTKVVGWKIQSLPKRESA